MVLFTRNIEDQLGEKFHTKCGANWTRELLMKEVDVNVDTV